MGIKRNIDTSLWNDPKIVEDFTAEDKFFWLYVLTNPHNTLCGTAVVSPRTIANEMGYSKETIENLIYRFSYTHKLIKYDSNNSEMLILNWHKYNWTTSESLKKSLNKQLKDTKTIEFRDYILSKINELKIHGVDTVPTPSLDGSISISKSKSKSKSNNNSIKKTKAIKNNYGLYKNIKLTEEEYQKLLKEPDGIKAIEFLSEYIELKDYKVKSHYLAIKKWVLTAVDEKQVKEAELAARKNKIQNQNHNEAPPPKPNNFIENVVKVIQKEKEKEKYVKVYESEDNT